MNMNEKPKLLKKDKACEQYIKQDSSNGKITLTSHPRHAIIQNLEVPPHKKPIKQRITAAIQI